MAAVIQESVLREELFDRRQKLETAITASDDTLHLTGLLREVDDALERMGRGAYGLCEVCHDPVERERLIADPLVSVCLGCLSPVQRRALEDDLELAARIQATLLPPQNFTSDGWQVSYHYEAAQHVSGDYIDLVGDDDGQLYFMLGDVSGKGIAASMLMTQLHAMFRTLIPLGLPLNKIVERASRIFCESTLPTHFATLVCGRADAAGEVEVCNAGHLPPLLIHEGRVTSLAATGMPIGVFCNEQFTSLRVTMAPGDTLLLYTDGLSEARDASDAEYGTERLLGLVGECLEHTPASLVTHCLKDLLAFSGDTPRTDDLTIMAIRRAVKP